MVRHNYTTIEWQSIRGFDNKTIGKSNGRIFKKTIRGSIHLLRKPPAIAIDADAYDKHIAFSHQLLEIYDSETNRLYTSSTEDFNLHRIEFDRGHGKQYALAMNHWHVTDLNPDAPQQLTFNEAFNA